MDKNIIKIKTVNDHICKELIDIWHSSVKATHHFLSQDDFISIKSQLQNYIPKLTDLYGYIDDNNKLLGFMYVNDKNLDMLFIDNDYRGQGIGKKLLVYAIEHLDVISLDVNEDNPLAKGFYEHIGFKVVSRSEKDDQGRPFPILHMSL